MNVVARAEQLLEEEQVEEALRMIKNALADADDDDKYAIAELYKQWGFVQEAKAILEELIVRYPDEGELKVMLADVCLEQNDVDRAIVLLHDIDQQDEAYLQALIQLADLYETEGLFEVAEQKLLEAKQMAPDNSIIDFALGEFYFSTGSYKHAATHYEKVLKQTKTIMNTSIQERLAETYALLGEFEAALDLFQEENTGNSETLFKYGMTAHLADRNDIAIKAWERITKQDPAYFSVYSRLAKVYEEEGYLQEAYETALKALQVDEYNKELFFLAGKLAHQLQYVEESIQYLDRAIALDADYKAAVLLLIDILKKNDDYEKVIELLSKIKESGADDSLYIWELARSYKEIESYDNALMQYQEAYNSLNRNSDFLKEYGYFLVEEGRAAEAINIFSEFVQLVPDDYDVVEYMERLREE